MKKIVNGWKLAFVWLVALFLLVLTVGFASALNVTSVVVSPDNPITLDNLTGNCTVFGNESSYGVTGVWYKNGLLYDVDEILSNSFSTSTSMGVSGSDIVLDINYEPPYIFHSTGNENLRIYNSSTHAGITAGFTGAMLSASATDTHLYTRIGTGTTIRIFNISSGNNFTYWKDTGNLCGSGSTTPSILRVAGSKLWLGDYDVADGCVLSIGGDGDLSVSQNLSFRVSKVYVTDDYVVLHSGANIYVYNHAGTQLKNFSMSTGASSVGIVDGLIYGDGEVYSVTTGSLVATWDNGANVMTWADEHYVYSAYGTINVGVSNLHLDAFLRDNLDVQVYDYDQTVGLSDVYRSGSISASTTKIMIGTQDSYIRTYSIPQAQDINNDSNTVIGQVFSGETSFGDEWLLQCTLDGLSVNSSSVTIVNQSDINDVYWNESVVDEYDSLFGFCSGVDRNATNFTMYARSYRNDSLVSESSSLVSNYEIFNILNESSLSVGDEWVLGCGLNRSELEEVNVTMNQTVNQTLPNGTNVTVNQTVNVTVNQSINVTYWWNSTGLVVVQNALPVLTDLTLTNLGASMFCGFTYNDTENLSSKSFLWYVNESLVGGETGQNLSSSFYGASSSVRCSAWANNSLGQETGYYNSSIYLFNDSSPPVLSGASIPSTAQVDTTVDLEVSCVDGEGEVASGFPKISFLSPENVSLGNFTMSSLGGNSYRYSYVFPTLGDYSNFVFYCKDGSNNLDSLVYTGNLSIVSQPVLPPAGGGGGGGEEVEKPVCSISLTPESLRITQPNELYEVVIRNDELSSFDPTFTFVADDDIGFSLSRLQISNPVVSLLPSSSTSFGIQYVGNATTGGLVTLVLSSAQCADIALPINVDFSGGLALFTDLFGEGFTLNDLVGLNVFKEDGKLTKLGFNFAWLFGLLFVLWGVVFVTQAIKSVNESKVLRAFVWLAVWLVVTSVTSLLLLVLIRGGV